MRRFKLKLDESDEVALEELLKTRSRDESRALIEAHPIYADPVFLRKALAWSRSNPEVGSREIAFCLQHAHLLLHRSLASAPPAETDAPGSGSARELPVAAPPPPPPFFEALLALLDGQMPQTADAPRLPTDTLELLDDLASIFFAVAVT